ncbi:hypothetical protein [Acrocarpospora phusangensis]|nr:hypothetical protein [Acrocarpospora phusangensis]
MRVLDMPPRHFWRMISFRGGLRHGLDNAPGAAGTIWLFNE